jgi:REP element-mobilizing transposase RayT
MILNEIGKNIEKIFFDYFKNKYFKMDEYILMQDHFHIIIMIDNKYDDVGAGLLPALNENNERVNNENNERATTRVAPTTNKTLGKIIGELKSIITNEYIKNVKIKNWPRFDKRLWQRDYYERIIRNEKEYFKIKEYIKSNPKIWERDRYNLKNI